MTDLRGPFKTLLDAAKVVQGLHDELMDEADDGKIDDAFARWDAAIDMLLAAIEPAEKALAS